MPFTAEQKRKAAKLYQGGKSLRQVASEFGCSHVTVRTLLKEMGVPLRKHGQRGSSVVHEIVALRSAGATFKRIAEVLGISREHARRLHASHAE